MRRLLLMIVLLLSFVLTYAQTSTKKYNSFYKRYEYFDSRGNMIGYEKWNDLYKQWEYHETGRSQNNNSQRNYQPYVSGYNYDLALQALSAKQAEYDKRTYEEAKIEVNNMITNVKNIINRIYDEYDKKDASWSLTSYQKGFFTGFEDKLEKTTEYDAIMNYENTLSWLNYIEKEVNSWRPQQTSQSTYIKSQQQLKKTYKPGTYEVYTFSPVMSIDNSRGKQIGKTTKKVKVLNKASSPYYRIQTEDGKTGYLHEGWIK